MNKLKIKQIQLILILLVFCLPVISALVIYKNGLFNKGATNKGTFLYEQNIRLKSFKKKIWTVLYFVPKNCTLSCTKAQKIINQLPKASGRNHNKFITELIFSDDKKKYPYDLDKNYIYIADPSGLVILKYKIYDNYPYYIFGKNILKDLNKLIKYSKWKN